MRNYLSWLPLVQPILFAFTFALTYSVAVKSKHVYPFWPYISDTGTLPPESCIFSLLLNISCVIVGLIIYLRHEQVSEFTISRPFAKISRFWNLIGSVTGFIGVFGLALVANFQETNVFWVHIIGALICFSFSTVYFLFQCIFTYQMKFASKLIFWCRVIFTAINVIAFPMIFAPIKAATEEFKGNNVLMWSPKDGGYNYHLTSTISEWILVLSFSLYVSTFYWELKRFHVIAFTLKFIERERETMGDYSGPGSGFQPAASWL